MGLMIISPPQGGYEESQRVYYTWEVLRRVPRGNQSLNQQTKNEQHMPDIVVGWVGEKEFLLPSTGSGPRTPSVLHMPF